MLLGDEYQAIREGTVTFAQIHEMFNTVPADSTAGQAGLRRLSARIGSPGSASSADSGRPQPLRRAASAAAGKRSPASKSNRVTELFLTTSYRSSPEITALFAGLLPAEQQILVSSVQPSGYAPEFSVCKAKEEYAQALVAAVQKAEQQEGLTAIVCVGARSMEKTAALLIEYMAEGSALPAAGSSAGSSTDNSANNSADNTAGMNAAGSDLSDSGSLSGVDLLRSCPVPVIRSGGSLPEKGVFLITLAHAKGLEFDGVILPDANADNYPDTLLARHRLYTALSRATRRLTVLARGSLTPLLQDKNDQDKQN
jgi:DNA helicase-2/ATP-dependent DNA helicase PcrA